MVGARPQFVKAAVTSRIIRSTDGISEVLVHTGQHYDENMSKIFFEDMDIPMPSHQLHVNGMTHGKMTGRMMEGLEELMMAEKPDVVLVYGDTNSTLAGSLTASKLHIPIAHVEAGIRSFNWKMPEEVNRVLTDRMSKWLFCPTETAISNLKREGFDALDNSVINVGDIMYDAMLYYRNQLTSDKLSVSNLPERFALCTLHRQENVHHIDRLTDLIEGLNFIHNNIIPIVLPLHPSTANRVKQAGLKIDFQAIEPVGYFDMIHMLDKCEIVVTDSGGLQKEAYFFNKFCITMRDETEWVELVDNGLNSIVGADKALLIKTVESKLKETLPKVDPLYGKGNAGEIIVNNLIRG